MNDDIATVALYFREKQAILQAMQEDETCRRIARVVDLVWDVYQRNGTVFACANGGGAGLVDNLTTDLAFHPFVSDDKGQSLDIRRLKVKNLCASASVLTGVANDFGYAKVFVRQLEGELVKGDLVLGFSGSGNSENILESFRYARARGAFAVCISGRGGGKANDLADVNIVIPGTSRFPGQTGGNDNNFHIEDLQVELTHIVCGLIKQRVKELQATTKG